ncbi:MAG: hypothetical protein ACI97A_000521 [Planctomycetota bacterium]
MPGKRLEDSTSGGVGQETQWIIGEQIWVLRDAILTKSLLLPLVALLPALLWAAPRTAANMQSLMPDTSALVTTLAKAMVAVRAATTAARAKTPAKAKAAAGRDKQTHSKDLGYQLAEVFLFLLCYDLSQDYSWLTTSRQI